MGLYCRISCIFIAAVLLNGYMVTCAKNTHRLNNKESADHTGGGSGGWTLHFSDDEDLMDSGSGSGSGLGDFDTAVQMVKTKTPLITSTTTSVFSRTTDHPLTDCEITRQQVQSMVHNFGPRCLPNGDFDSLQCHGNPGTTNCWCSDLLGNEIPGTLMDPPNYPNCDDGNNLPPCIYQLVKHKRSKLLGSFQPKCAADGQFDRVQCHGSSCFCVEESTGHQVPGTNVHIADKHKVAEKCDKKPAVVDVSMNTTKQPQPDKDSTEDNIDIDEEPHRPTQEVNVNIGKDDSDESRKDEEIKKGLDKFSEDNKSEKPDEEVEPKIDHDTQREDKVEKASEIMTQPGILAGIIGGSVVLLLCLVLLAMFIVYRMRKKDEGSYPLDEPRKAPNYNYVRAPEKEFYA